ncbi:MAG: hypothetical protein A4E61_00130 [Syntrophorhabdus sp. PtaB.Bin184]|nr:MAG: hypothetical protein A4E61_00130 [Syntrophorhabdus sp. PtaB.Bin184]
MIIVMRTILPRSPRPKRTKTTGIRTTLGMG